MRAAADDRATPTRGGMRDERRRRAGGGEPRPEVTGARRSGSQRGPAGGDAPSARGPAGRRCRWRGSTRPSRCRCAGAPRSSSPATSAGGSSGSAGPPRAGRRWWPTPSCRRGARQGAKAVAEAARAGAAPAAVRRSRARRPRLDARREATLVAFPVAASHPARGPDLTKERSWTSTPCSVTTPMPCSATRRRASPKEDLHLPGPGLHRSGAMAPTDRSPVVLRNLASLYDHGRLARHRLRVDPPGGPGHRALGRGVVRAEPGLLRPGQHLPARGRGRVQRAWPRPSACSVRCSRAVRPQDPVHREAQPQRAADLPEQVRPDHVRLGQGGVRPRRGRRRGHDLLRLGAVDPPDPGGVGRLQGGPRPGACSRCCGATCATAPSRPDGVDYHVAADLTGQANHIGVTIEADIIKQKLPENNGGYNALAGYGKTSKLVYDELTTDHPIDLCRWQVANCYMGRIGLDQLAAASRRAPATWPRRSGPR